MMIVLFIENLTKCRTLRLIVLFACSLIWNLDNYANYADDQS